MIKSIKIEIKNLFNNIEYYIDCLNNTININGDVKKIDSDTIDNIVRYLIFFNNIDNDSIIDGEEYYILIETDDEKVIYNGKSDNSINYINFRRLLGEL